MFERFTDRSRQVLVLAQHASERLKSGFIGTEHLLYALAAEGEGHSGAERGIAAQVLAVLGVTPKDIEVQIREIVGEGDNESGNAPFTPRAKKVLELSLREALQLGHNWIGTEHILLGLLRENEGVGSDVLKALGVAPEQIREGVVDMMGTFASKKDPVPKVIGGRGPASDLARLDLSQAQYLAVAVQSKIMTVDEAREIMGLPPLDKERDA